MVQMLQDQIRFVDDLHMSLNLGSADYIPTRFTGTESLPLNCGTISNLCLTIATITIPMPFNVDLLCYVVLVIKVCPAALKVKIGANDITIYSWSCRC